MIELVVVFGFRQAIAWNAQLDAAQCQRGFAVIHAGDLSQKMPLSTTDNRQIDRFAASFIAERTVIGKCLGIGRERPQPDQTTHAMGGRDLTDAYYA